MTPFSIERMGDTFEPSGAPAGTTPPASAVPDTLTADLLAKHAAGEKLTPSQYGKLGALKRKLASLIPGKAGAPAQSPLPPAGPGQSPGVVSLASAQASPGELPPVPIDAGIARRTAAAILNRCDLITVRWIENNARRAGATGATLDRFRAAASLSADDKTLLTDLAPDVLAELGVDPRRAPLWTAIGVLGLHSANLMLCVDELKAMQRERNGGTDKPAKTETPKPADAAALPEIK